MRTIPALLFVIAWTPVAAWAQPAITTSFTSSLGGWTGDLIDHRPANGNPGGFARFIDDPNVSNSVIVAPSQYHGSWLGYEDVGALSYDHKILTAGGMYTVADYRVDIYGPNDSATWLSPPSTGPGPWRRLVAPIKESEWFVLGDWNQLLSNITRLEIQIEHVANDPQNPAIDIEGIDNVKLYVLPPPSADFDNDNDVDGNDFLIWQQNQGTGTQLSQGDANDTGSVNSVDLAIWNAQYDTPPPIFAVPEPTLGVLLLTLSASLSFRGPARDLVGSRGDSREVATGRHGTEH